VPVVRARDGELRGHGGRPQARAVGRAEADAERLGRPEEGDRVVLRMRVRGDGDGDLHWLSLSLYSIRLSPPVATTAAWGAARTGTPPGVRWGSGCLGCPGSESSIGPRLRAYSAYWNFCVHRFRDHVFLGSRCVVSSCVFFFAKTSCVFLRKCVIVCRKRFPRPRAMLTAIWATVDQRFKVQLFHALAAAIVV
jgi:hypothetical protein